MEIKRSTDERVLGRGSCAGTSTTSSGSSTPPFSKAHFRDHRAYILEPADNNCVAVTAQHCTRASQSTSRIRRLQLHRQATNDHATTRVFVRADFGPSAGESMHLREWRAPFVPCWTKKRRTFVAPLLTAWDLVGPIHTFTHCRRKCCISPYTPA